MIISFLCRFSIQFLQTKIISQILSAWNLLEIFTFFVSTAWAESHWILGCFWGEVNIAELEAARTLLAIGDTCQAISSYWYLKTRKGSNYKAAWLRRLSIESAEMNGGVEIEHWRYSVSQDEQRFDELRTLEWKPSGRASSIEGIGDWECSVSIISRGATFYRTEKVRSEFFRGLSPPIVGILESTWEGSDRKYLAKYILVLANAQHIEEPTATRQRQMLFRGLKPLCFLSLIYLYVPLCLQLTPSLSKTNNNAKRRGLALQFLDCPLSVIQYARHIHGRKQRHNSTDWYFTTKVWMMKVRTEYRRHIVDW